MLKVGLTGGIACGKSKTLSFFHQLGALTIDADLISREVVRRGQPAYQKIVEEFGHRILAEDGEVNRARLGELIFSDDSARAKLNSIVHPYVLAEEKRRIEGMQKDPTQHPIVVVDAALMIEVGSFAQYDVLIVVYCPPSLQLERLMKRNSLNRTEAEKRITSQMPLLEKVRYGDYIVETSRDPVDTQEQIRYIYADLLEMT